MKKLLFGYDGSDQAKQVMSDLAAATLPTPLHATVLTVADVWMPATAGLNISKTAKATLAEAKKISAQGARRLKGLFPDWEISSESIADSPGWGILKRAEFLRVDLVAIGAHSQPAIFDRYLFGSVASEIIISAPCSVRICRPRERQNPNLRIIVTIDGSDDSALAFHQIRMRHWPPGSEFRVVTALDSKIHDALLGSRFSESVNKGFARSANSISDLSQELAAELRAQRKSAEALFLSGNPKSEILQVAEDWNADCIFVGARGLHHGCERRLGSVASALARWSRCSVEICRPTLNRL